LADIWSYLAEEASETTATRFVRKLYAACGRLMAFPLAYPERPQLAPGLRVVFHGNYAIYYQPDDDCVTVVRVLHGARDLAAIVEQGGFDMLAMPEAAQIDFEPERAQDLPRPLDLS